VREHVDEVQQLRASRGVPLLDPTDPKTKEHYGLWNVEHLLQRTATV
jgi:hypothetical protein